MRSCEPISAAPKADRALTTSAHHPAIRAHSSQDVSVSNGPAWTTSRLRSHEYFHRPSAGSSRTEVHLFLDADLGDVTVPIPTMPDSIVHMGDASSAYTFENVASGPHRLIAVVADGAHVPLQPLVVDTVHFVVE
jgi:hypothetical protein